MNHQINLLPDSKQQKLSEKRFRKLVSSIAFGIMAVAVGVPIILLTIKGTQALNLRNTQNQINERKAQIQQTPNITTMLTVKDHLDALPGLYDQRAKLSNLLDTVPKILPTSIRLTEMDVDSTGRVTFKGVAATYNEVEKFYKAVLTYGIEFDPNRVEQDPNTTGLFTGVIVEEVSGPSGSEVAFTISTNFDPALISGASQ